MVSRTMSSATSASGDVVVFPGLYAALLSRAHHGWLVGLGLGRLDRPLLRGHGNVLASRIRRRLRALHPRALAVVPVLAWLVPHAPRVPRNRRVVRTMRTFF